MFRNTHKHVMRHHLGTKSWHVVVCGWHVVCGWPCTLAMSGRQSIGILMKCGYVTKKVSNFTQTTMSKFYDVIYGVIVVLLIYSLTQTALAGQPMMFFKIITREPGLAIE